MKATAQTLTSVYLLSAILIFTGATLAKVSSKYTSDELRLRDPFLHFLTEKQVLFIACFIELLVAGIILLTLKRAPCVGLGLSLWLSTAFVIYHMGVLLSPYAGAGGTACICFGGTGGILGKAGELVSAALLGYLVLFGVLCSVAFAKRDRKRPKPCHDKPR